MLIPRISKYMTPAPKTIRAEQTLEQAGDYMRKLRVRHLPVTKSGRPVGIISDRDISLALKFANFDALSMTVESILTPDPFITLPNEPINHATQHMNEKKYGCVLVMEQGLVVGIFTAIDALTAFANVFQTDNHAGAKNEKHT